MNSNEITIRECETVEDFQRCVELQKEAFGLPDIEITPRRHLIVSRQAGGWTLGAFIGDEMVGFVHHLAAVKGNEIFGYSHMMAVAVRYQNAGIGAKLKWAQREKALQEKRNFIKWTFEPMQARNAHFNLNRLGVVVRSYAVNFYGTDYNQPARDMQSGLDSDRLFAEWKLDSPRVVALSQRQESVIDATPAREIIIVSNWRELQKENPVKAREEQLRVRAEFEEAFSDGLICAAFQRDDERPRYLLYYTEEV
jgi:predicted GNAT superfamily acetyltransferase